MLNTIARTDGITPQELNFDCPVVNIGSHSENDVVLSGVEVLPFHATVHLQEGQFYLIALGGISAIKIDGVQLNTTSVKFSPMQRVEIGGYTLAFQQRGGADGPHVSVLRSAASGPVIAGQAVQIPITGPAGESPILVNVLPKQVDVEVGQTAVYELEIINAGPIVAGFSVSTQGLPDAWIKVEPSLVNLYEGQRATVRISVTPPRDPASKAGSHTLLANVSSSNYAGQRVQTQLTLNILPYYEFTIGSISPKQQRIYWRKRSGIVKLPISNTGNSEADFNVTAFDDENGCSFDFQVSKDVERSRQATLNIPAGQSISLPIEVTPLKRPIAALSSKSYHYTATTQVAQQSSLSQTVSGTVTSVPLIGWWTIVLTLAIILIGLFILVQPRIFTFEVAAGKDIIEQGDTTKLDWSVSPFATTLSLSNFDQAINRGQVSQTIAPTQSTTYELVASNWLSGLFGLDQKRTQTVLVVPPKPVINVFEIDRTSVPEGTSAKVRWSVSKADKALLTIDKVVYELKPDQFSGEQQVVPTKDSLVTLEAVNASGSELRSYFIKVVPPKITVNSFAVWVRPAATASVGIPSVAALDLTGKGGGLLALSPAVLAKGPEVGSQSPTVVPPDPNFPEKYVEMVPDRAADSGYRVEFYQPTRELQKGEQIMIQWDIEGADNDKLQIAPFTDALPSRGAQPYFPQESMNFVMTAKSGKLEKLFMLPVKVFDGTPPKAPTIEFFQATPEKMKGAGKVQFAWSVSGEWTRIQISTEKKVIADYLTPQGFKTINVSASGTYILTAWNGTLSSAKPKDITVDPTLREIGIKIKSVYSQGNSNILLVGGTANVTIDFFSDPNNPASDRPSPEPTGKVLISDGASSCPVIDLPANTCTLKFDTPGSPKEIKATYYGDSTYLPATSKAYTGITVNSSKVKLSVNYYYLVKPGMTQGNPIGDITNTPLELDDGLYLVVKVTPINTTLQNDQKGKIAVRFCQQLSGPAIGTCDGMGVSTVTVPTGATYGTADLVIQNFPSAGTRALQIEYHHDNYAIDTETINQFDVHINRLGIYLSLPVCTDPDALTGCNVGAAALDNGRVMFDIKNVADNSMLSVLLPSPTASDFSIYHSNSGTQANWPCLIVEKSSTYKLECTNINFATFGSRTVNWQYTATGVYDLLPASGNFALNVSKSTSISLTASKLVGVKVGQPILVTDNINPSNQLVKLMDASLSPPSQTILATGKIIISDTNNTSGLFGITSNSPGCSLAAGGSQLEINSRTARCEMFFNHVGTGPFTLNFSYIGDPNYAASSTSTQVTVAKQTGIATRWQYKNSQSVYTDWDITSWSPDSPLLPVRIILYDSTSSPLPDYAGESIKGRKVHISINIISNPNNGVCTLATNSYVSGSNNEYDIAINPVGNDYAADFDAKCTQAQMNVNFNLSIATAEQADLGFAASPTAITIRNVFFANRGILSMNVRMVRIADSHESASIPPGNTNGNIEKLFVGEGYKIIVDVGTIWADYFLDRKPSPANLTEAQDYYFKTPLTITLPNELQNRVDTNNSTCSYESATKTVSVPFTLYSYNAKWGDDGTRGYSDIRLSNSSNPCTLVFVKGTEVGATVEGAVFRYNAPSPFYSWGFDKTISFQMAGLGKQNITMTFGSPVVTPAVGDSTLNLFVNQNQNFNVSLAGEVPGTSLAPLTASGLLELGKPSACTTMTSSVTYTAPASSATTNLSFPQACTGTLVVSYNGNDYYSITSKNITTTVTAATTTTTAILPSANPSKYGQAVTFTATVSPSTATGFVQFNIDGTDVGSAKSLLNGIATYTTTAFQLSVSSTGHEIKATYQAAPGFIDSIGGPIKQVVDKSETNTTLSSLPNPSFLGDSVTFTATVTAKSPGTGTPTGKVQFKDGNNDLGLPVDVTNATYSTTALTAGTHSITAVYEGDANYATSTSNQVSQAVKLKTQTTLQSNNVNNITKYGESVTFSAIVTVLSPGTGTPTGSVQFKDGIINLGSPVDLNSNGVASLPIDTMAASNTAHNITAEYTPQNGSNFAASTSTPALAHTVQPASTAATLNVSPTTGTAATTLTLTVTVTVVAPGAGTPTGAVRFYDGPVNANNLISTAQLQQTDGTATFTTTLAVGTHNLRATFTSSSANFTTPPTTNIVAVTIN